MTVETAAPDWAPVYKPYSWIEIAGGLVRARCNEHGRVMKWRMKIDKRYPRTPSRKDPRVVYEGLPLQVWRCPYENCEVEVVK